MKNKKTTKRIELDTEVVADLEATDAETEAIRGGAANLTRDAARSTNGSNGGPAGGTAT